jgi:hypothetical protein
MCSYNQIVIQGANILTQMCQKATQTPPNEEQKLDLVIHQAKSVHKDLALTHVTMVMYIERCTQETSSHITRTDMIS